MSLKSSIGKFLVRELPEIGEDILTTIAKRFEGQAATDATKQAAVAAARKAAPPSLSVVPKAAAPAVIKARAGSAAGVARDVLQEAARKTKPSESYASWRAKNPGHGQLFDTSNLAVVPNVPQSQMERYAAPRGPSARIVEALDNPEVARGIDETVQRGIEGGGLEWYNTDPLRERIAASVPDPDQAYARMMDIMAATSPRSKVTDNIRTGSYYNYLLSQGLPIPEKPAKGYGSVAQNLHRENVRGLEERGGWDIFRNPKPASFSSNLQGNQRNVTIDTHNFRLPGILSGDPRFLETTIAELADSPEAGVATLRRQYPRLPEDVAQMAVKPRSGGASINYRPQEWAAKGYIPMEEAVNDPAVWSSKPNPNEYGYYEKWQQDRAAKMGISPAQYQAAMWLGGGEATGLGSAAEPFLGTFEARVKYTADRLGMDPEKVLDLMVKGEIPLLAKGGRVGQKALGVSGKGAKRGKTRGRAFAARPPKAR